MCHNDHHRAHIVFGHKIAPEQSIDRVAESRTIGIIMQHLGDTAQISHSANGDIRQWNANLTALARLFPPTNGSQHCKCRIGAADDIPSRQHMVDWFRASPSHHWIANGIINRVIKCRCPVGPAHNPNGHKVCTPFSQFCVGKKTFRGKVGDKLPGDPHQFLQQLAPLRARKIKRD